VRERCSLCDFISQGTHPNTAVDEQNNFNKTYAPAFFECTENLRGNLDDASDSPTLDQSFKRKKLLC
jgi:hypothetical protein